MELQPMRPGDWPPVRAIYEAGIATGDATFETTAPDWPAWDAAHLPGHRLVARVDGQVVSWTALAPCRTAARTPGWPRTASTSPPRPRARASAGPC